VEVVKERFATHQGCRYFDFNSWYDFHEKTPNDFLRDDFTAMLAEFLVELLQLFYDLKVFLREDKASLAALENQASSGS
jgi:hypothetical protein